MRIFLAKIRKLWRRWFPKRKTRRPNLPRQTFEGGGHYYLGDLLETLDDYGDVVRSLKNHHPDAYDYYTQVGCSVFSETMVVDRQLHPRWRDGSKRPAIMMCHWKQAEKSRWWGDKDVDQDDTIWPAFSLLHKMRMVSGVQFTNGDMYECILFYREKKSDKIICGMPFYMAIDAVGDLSIMRVLKQVPSLLPSKKTRYLKGQVQGLRKQSHSLNGHTIQRWGMPWYLQEMSKDHKLSPKKIAEILFITTAAFSETSANGLLIRAKKNEICSAFAIDLLRTPYFFKDRIKVKTPSGNTKPIFHIVRTHPRKGSKLVKTHFRGLRRFKWHDHDVTISMPGYHHAPVLSHFDATAYRFNDPLADPDTMDDLKKVGAEFDKHMEKGWRS